MTHTAESAEMIGAKREQASNHTGTFKNNATVQAPQWHNHLKEMPCEKPGNTFQF